MTFSRSKTTCNAGLVNGAGVHTCDLPDGHEGWHEGTWKGPRPVKGRAPDIIRWDNPYAPNSDKGK
jgi:hypothetical protein